MKRALSAHKKGKIRSRNRLKPDVRAKQILRGAITFFAEHGFAGQTRGLAAGLGVSEGLLYRYFPTKEALFDSVYEEVFFVSAPSDVDVAIQIMVESFYLGAKAVMRPRQSR